MQLLRSLKDEDSEKEQAIWSTTWLNVTTFLLFKSLLESAVLFLTVSLLVRRSNPEIEDWLKYYDFYYNVSIRFNNFFYSNYNYKL